MNLQDVRTLIDYHYWARDRMLEAVDVLDRGELTRELGNSFSSIRDTLVHLYGAERIWCARWQGEAPQGMPDPAHYPDLAAIRGVWSDQEARLRAVVDGLDEAGVQRVIEYRMLNGQQQSQPFWQMLQHVVNHGSYHRGQVTTMLRQLGAAPPKAMDLIAFYRERASGVS